MSNQTLKERQSLAKQSAQADLEKFRADSLEKIRNDIKPLEVKKHAFVFEIEALTEQKRVLADEISEKRNELSLLCTDVENTQKEMLEIQQRISQVTEKLDSLTGQKIELERQLAGLQESINSGVTKVTQLQEEQTQLQGAISRAQEDLDDLQKDYETRKAALDDELRGILIQTQDAVIRLKELKEREVRVLGNIAEKRQVLDKERQALAIKEAKLSDADARIAKAGRMMKL